MKHLKRIVLILIFPLFAFTSAHKFYVSVTHVNYAEKDKSVQIISRIFIDDLEDLLEERYHIKPKLATKDEHEKAAFYIEKYVMQHFLVEINGKPTKLNFLGKEYEDDVVKCYLETDKKVKHKKIKTIQIKNTMLFELFEEQQNIIHIKLKNKRKSFMLMKENDKALLKL